MLVRLSPRQRLEALAATWEPTLRAAWDDALDRIRSNIVFKRIVERLDKGDVAGAINELGIQDGAFAKFEQAIVQAYHAGGIDTVDNMPALRDPSGNRIVFSWGVRNLPAEQEMRRSAADFVTSITAETKDGIREILTENLSRGQSPYDAGRLLAGRVNRFSGKREGGLIGLSRPQMQTVASIERGMLDGDADAMRRYLGLKLRDKRLDRSVTNALKEGRGLSQIDAERVARLYANKALKYRGDVIARHETMAALDKSRDDAFRQQIADGKVIAEEVTKGWRHQTQEHPRLQHVAMNRQVVQFGQPFVAPDGTALRYPRDPAAPAAHTLGCRCYIEYNIAFGATALRRFREGLGA
jgi:hypothetical protein